MKLTMKLMMTCLAGAMTLSGCMTVEGGGVGGGPDVGEPAGRDIGAYDALNARADAVGRLADSNVFPLLPTGNLSYSGAAIASDVSINGENGYRMVGNLNMRVNFSGSTSDVNGEITNIDLFDGRTPIERLAGDLDVDATFTRSGRTLAGDASGELRGVFDNGTEGTVDMTWGLDGDMRRVSGNNSYAFYGDDTTGSGDGVVEIEINDGQYYATR